MPEHTPVYLSVMDKRSRNPGVPPIMPFLRSCTLPARGRKPGDSRPDEKRMLHGIRRRGINRRNTTWA